MNFGENFPSNQAAFLVIFGSFVKLRLFLQFTILTADQYEKLHQGSRALGYDTIAPVL